MKPIIIHHRSVHHASNSGYSRLVDYMPLASIISGAVKFPYRLAKFISVNTNQLAGNYDSLSVLKEIELFHKLTKNEHQVVHYLNTERDIRHLINYKQFYKNTAFCGTFHKPPSILKEQFSNIKYLKKLDGAITVGSNQVDFIKNWLNIENVKYIPHGVDTDFFIPDESKKKQNTLLFVGQHLRDFEAFNYCIPKIAEQIKNLKVNVVLRKDYNLKIEPHRTIQLHNGIDDTALKTLYQEASLLFLPLKDVTACNSILEAMACGLPIITSEVGGNIEYLKWTNSVLAPTIDTKFYIDATIDLLRDESKLKILGDLSRKKSLMYSWDSIAQKVTDFYKTIEV